MTQALYAHMNNKRKKKKENVVAIYTMEFYSVLRKNDTLCFKGKWMQLEDIMLSEVSQAQKDNSSVFSFICGRQIPR
jgi:hypothetical protein